MKKTITLGMREQIVVVQIGARRHYAIPRMLERAGRLKALYTDTNAATGLGRWINLMPIPGKNNSLKKLKQRQPHGIPPAKIRNTDALLWHRIAKALRIVSKSTDHVGDDLLFDRIAASWEFHGAGTLYAMQKHGNRLLDAAKAAGVRTVVDVFITPKVFHIVEQERARFPDIEAPSKDLSSLENEDERTRREIDLADLLLCPGHNVVDGLAAFPNANGKAFAVVPYGCGISFNGISNDPVPGRILFAGSADLRKGIHYLGMAAKELAEKNLDFRVAGNVSEAVYRHPLMSELRFLGRLSRYEMIEELLRADVLVLPTLAEGCASVVHEAIMAGCPVITTRSSGTLVENGRGGLLVAEREPEALAAAISTVVLNRNRRAELAVSCGVLAKELCEERWSHRLLAALDNERPARIGIEGGAVQTGI